MKISPYLAGWLLAGLLWPGVTGAALSGQLMVDPTTNRWLVYNRDNNGDGLKDPFFMCGPGDPEGLLYLANASTLVSRLIPTGANSLYAIGIRSWGDGGTNEDPFINHRDSHSGINQQIITNWRTILKPADDAGIATHFFFYDDTTQVGGEMGWPLQNGELHPEEKAYIDAVVNTLEGLKHIVWSVAEESQEMGSDYFQHVSKIAQEIRLADDNDHPITTHQLNGTNFIWADDTNLDQFAMQYNVPTAQNLHDGMIQAWGIANGRYNLNMAESANYGTGAVARQKNWAVATGGAYVMVLGWKDFLNTSDLQQCGYLVDFFESTDFNTMAPHDELKSGGTTYVLANPGVSYIGYAPSLSGNMGFKGLTSGAVYTLKWLDTVSGNTVTQSQTTTASEQSWPKPTGFGSEVAVYLKRGSGSYPSSTPMPPVSPTRTPTPNPTPSDVPGSLISNLVVYDTANAAGWSVQTNLQTGNVQYSDRIYTLDSIGTLVTGTQWIRTANASRGYPTSPVATFTLTSGATVYIAWDDRFTNRPSWMAGYTDTGQNIINSEPVTFSIFSANFGAGQTVTLGPMSSTLYNMYTVMVKGSASPTPTPLPWLPGDANGDGLINGVDYVIWFNHYKLTGGGGAAIGDFNNSGTVDGVDFVVWLNNYTGGNASPTGTATPTPAPISGTGYCETAGRVTVEAEHYSGNSGYDPVARTDASGGTAMQIGTTTGMIDFSVNLTTGGRWYIWLRTLAADSATNGLILYLDGQPLAAPADHLLAGQTEIYLKKNPTLWFWTPEYYGYNDDGTHSGPVTMDTTAGLHTLSITKRKSERPLIDKIVLTTANSEPGDLGPAETPCS